MTNGLHDVELLSMEIHVVFNKKIEKKVNNYKLKKKNMYVNNYFDIFVFLLFLIIFLHETIKNNKEKEEYKKLVNVLKEEVSFLREEVNKINNKNIKLETNIFNTNKDLEEKINKRFRKVYEFNLDFNLKYPLFLNSLKYLKSDIESILVQQNINIQYIYYYLANLDDIRQYNSKYFKIIIFCRKLFNYFDDIKDLKKDNSVFFTEKFKKEMLKLSKNK